MQCRKSHIPLVPRVANYSCSLTNKTVRKKFASTQTDKCPSPFQNFFQSSQIYKEEVAFNEETTKAYSLALEYVNSFHSYMNGKLGEIYGESGDAKAEGTQFFKLPEVPNYASIFFMLLEKTKTPQFMPNEEIDLKKQDNTIKEPKKYTTKDSIIEFVPQIKKMPEFQLLEQQGALDEVKIVEQEVQTVISYQIDDESSSSPSKTLSYDLSSISSKNIHTAISEDGPELQKEDQESKEILESYKKVCDATQDTAQEDTIEKRKEEVDLPIERPEESQNYTKTVINDSVKDDEKRVMMDIIRKRIQEEISTYLDSTTPSTKNEHCPRLVRSHFHIINIPPQINLLEYAQKKLERQLISEPRPITRAGYPEVLPKQFFNSSMCIQKPLSVTPSAPKKITDMFQKFSQENFRSLEETLMGDMMRCECNQSDGDSVILDDEEFQKINGHPEEQHDRGQHRNSSVGREKSNPLKLTVRDMSKVNEKVLNTIGLFTERGDIRPEFMDILEEQKKTKAKDSRNKQFRSRRQWDLQIHLNPKQDVDSSFTSVSTEKSFISLSSTDLKSDFETVKNVSQQVEYKE